MRRDLFATLSIATLVAIAIPTSSSFARRHAPPAAAFSGIQDQYCLQGKRWGWPGICLFSTYEQCLATASGTPDYCAENPQYLFREQSRGYGYQGYGYQGYGYQGYGYQGYGPPR
jgi:hypothetical protein